MAARVLDALVPSFAEAGGAYVFEQLLGVDPASEVTAAGPARPVVRRLATRFPDDRQPAFGAAFPSGAVVVLSPDSPSARCLRDGIPVAFAGPLRPAQLPSSEARATLGRYTSFLSVPMITRGAVIGMLILARGPDAAQFRAADTRAAADLAARAGAAIADSLALMRHRSVAEAVRPPRSAVTHVTSGRLEVTGRCLPTTGCDVGGDWYDIISLPGERTGLIVGDVMGHGATAATVMTRLSAVAYALADLDLPPAEVLRQLNRTALVFPQNTLVTCAYAIIDPARQSCEIATAGHLPPVLAMPDGTTRVPGIPGGQSLGVAHADYGQARIKLRPGTVLALYTDGLVETRTRSFDQGILTLRSALAGQRQDLDSACEELIAALGDTREDDITIVLARIPPGPDD